MTEMGPTATPQEDTSKAGSAGKPFAWIAVSAALLLVTLMVCAVSFAGADLRAEWIARHGPAVIGIPTAILVATIVVSGARALDGETKFAFLGFAIAGGGAAVLLWLTIFITVVLAIRGLW